MFNLKKRLQGSRLKCAAVTPVGPGHTQRALECRASIESAWRQHPGPFSRLDFHFVDDGRGELGRSKARNDAVRAAARGGADWIFFLDADDLMTPSAFSIFEEYAADFDAVWGLMAIKPPDSADYHVRFPQALTLRSLDELLLLDPFMTLLMGHFVRTSVAIDLPFDENMDAGEDFDYYIRVWQKYRCTKIAQVLSVNRSDQHSSGPRAATADQWRIAASARLAAAREKNNLLPGSQRAISAVNRCSVEAQAFNRARDSADAADLSVLAGRLPYRGRVEVSHCAGKKFTLFSNNDDQVALSIGWTGDYLAVASRLWQVLATDSQLILDIGADTGYFGLLAARAAPLAEVLCFEPAGAKFARLERNLTENDARNARAVRAAVGHSGAAGPLHSPVDGEDFPSHATSHKEGWPSVRRENVETMSVDSVVVPLAKSGACLVHIGLGGVIDEIVAGMTNTLKSRAPDILVTGMDAALGRQIESNLRQQGCRLYVIDEDKSTIDVSSELMPTDGSPKTRWATWRPADEVARISAAAYLHRV